MRLTASRQPDESPRPMTRHPINPRPMITPKQTIPSNHPAPTVQFSVLPTTGPGRVPIRGGRYGPAGPRASSMTLFTVETNTTTPNRDSFHPHNVTTSQESKAPDRSLMGSTREGCATAYRQAPLRGRHSTPAKAADCGRRAPTLPHPLSILYRYDTLPSRHLICITHSQHHGLPNRNASRYGPH